MTALKTESAFPHIEITSGSELSGLREKLLLLEASFTAYERFIPFPEAAPACRPLKMHPTKLPLPKFSIFSGDEVTLNGFRLFKNNGQFFTDTSLSSKNSEESTTNFNKKISSGQTENIDFNKLSGAEEKFIDISRDGNILLPCSDEPSNFGSWIFRFLPKVLMSAALNELEAVMVYQQPWMTDMLRFAGVECELIKHEPTRQYRVKNPVIPSLPIPHVYFRPEVKRYLEPLHERQDDSISLGDYIYVSRRDQALKNPTMRAMENETGLVAALQELGFKEFCPGQYTFAQQISIFDKAKIIVGAGGSNMFGAIFARNAKLILDLESCREWVHAHANLMASTSAHWSMVFGEQTGRGRGSHGNWIIDIPTVLMGLKKLMNDV